MQIDLKKHIISTYGNHAMKIILTVNLDLLTTQTAGIVQFLKTIHYGPFHAVTSHTSYAGNTSKNALKKV